MPSIATPPVGQDVSRVAAIGPAARGAAWTRVPRSALEGVGWPAIPTAANSRVLALLQQLECSQWWTADRLQHHQLRQLERLLEHAYRANPFYRERLARAGYRAGDRVSPELWQRIPVLDRDMVREHDRELRAAEIPKAHGETSEHVTSGSTGRPLRIAKTGLDGLMWAALTLREEVWHRRDLSLPLAAIRRDPSGQSEFPEGRRQETWGFPVGTMFPTGPGFQLDNLTTIEQQVDWLRRRNPAYLMTFPTVVAEIARTCRAHGIRLQDLRGIRTVGEVVDAGLRVICREVFGVEVVDLYSAVETGYLALQCPEQKGYHVQAEAVLVEVLDAGGALCGPGEVGTVVVTVLHNFAMPLIRFAIGDMAEVGASCACGRGLPVISRILGRSRDLVRLPSGDRRYALLSFDQVLNRIPAVVQGQVVQKTVEDIEVRLVSRRPLSAEEEDAIRDRLIENFRYGFRVTFTYHRTIPRSAAGKFFDFLSELPT
ncbi:MAG TPA: hypothetical protein VKU84_12725 [Stellaceae bacterium]|nr:hypothetical protein [Stellaceae bacterium]